MSAIINSADAFKLVPGAVLLDTDNTLYSYDPAHRIAMHAVRAKAKQMFGITPDVFDRQFEIARSEIKARLRDTASSHSRLLYFQRTMEIIGLGSQVLMALDLEQTYWRTFLGNARLFEGVREFLDDLRLGGIPTTIVTDLTAQIQFRKLVHFGLDGYFDYVVTSEEAGFDKPHAAPFELAMSKMKIDGAIVWMIGDNPSCDIAGARRTIPGIVTIQKMHEGVAAGVGDERPDAIVRDFSEMRELFKKSLGR